MKFCLESNVKGNINLSIVDYLCVNIETSIQKGLP